MRLAIIGGRDFTDYDLLCRTLYDHWGETVIGGGTKGTDVQRTEVDEVISGGARGADSLGARWAREHHVKLTEFIPDWERFGKRAGFLRNEDIVKGCDMVLAFWDGVSKGTQHSIGIAKRLHKATLIIYYVPRPTTSAQSVPP